MRLFQRKLYNPEAIIFLWKSVLLSMGFILLFPNAYGKFNFVNAGSWVFDLISLTNWKQPETESRWERPPANQPLTLSNHILYSEPQLGSHARKYIRATPPEQRHKSSMSRSRDPFVRPLEYTGFNNRPRSSEALTDDVSTSSKEEAVCHALTGLTDHQRKICLQHSGLVWAMLEGTQLGMHECVHQFEHEQWNCSAVNLLYQMQMKSKNLPAVHGLEGILQRGSRETAFISSSWSAGVVQAITRACSRGQMGTCDCDPHRREGQGRDAEGIFTWGGCSDPIRFGMRLTRLFLDANDHEHRKAAIARENQLHGHRLKLSITGDVKRNLKRKSHRSIQSTNKSDKNSPLTNSTSPDRLSLSSEDLQAETLKIIQTKARVLMNMHNRKAGRRLVWKNRVTKCKCHGVSGACSMRTCWQRVNEFRLVGSMLKAAYDAAIRVTYEPRLDILRKVHLQSTSQPNLFEQNQDFRPNRRNTKQDSRGWLVLIGNRKENPYQYSDDHSNQRRWTRDLDDFDKLPKNKLVYLEESPNYCHFDETIGHLGIAGRQCNVTTRFAANSCDRLCCDRGYDTFEFETEKKCDCKFFWCCEVRCNICRERTVIHRCRH